MGVLVVPVVQDVAEQVGIRSGWQRLEEAAHQCLRAVIQTVGGEGACGLGRGRVQVDEPAAHSGVGREDRGEQIAGAAADVDHGGETGPLDAGDDLRDLFAKTPFHLPVERFPQMRALGEVGPEILPIAVRVGGLAGDDAVRELHERQLGATTRGVEVQEVGQTVVGVGAEIRPVGRGPISVGGAFGDAEGHEMADEPIKGHRGDVELGSELFRRRAVAEQSIRQPQGHCDPKRHRCRQPGHAADRVDLGLCHVSDLARVHRSPSRQILEPIIDVMTVSVRHAGRLPSPHGGSIEPGVVTTLHRGGGRWHAPSHVDPEGSRCRAGREQGADHQALFAP